ncbi:MAG: ATP-dependent Clp protease adaptor ClpS [Myxococcales bacterium]|nr:ATP-dependent Clp protease adaptor ClpS [Myxococcales bacterium]
MWQLKDRGLIVASDDKDKSKKPGGKRQEGIEVLERQKTDTPKLFRVILHNDDYTTQEFVTYVLQAFFRKDNTEARQIMLKAHMTGKAIVAVYTRDVAESKVQQVMDYARKNESPLLMTVEPET